jgi:hypothetical protein
MYLGLVVEFVIAAQVGCLWIALPMPVSTLLPLWRGELEVVCALKLG